ncbi:MAG: flagellar basal body-associated FliL family protein [Pseudomonadota bacterium]
MAKKDELNLGKGDSDGEEKSSGKGKLIIIIAVVLLLAGGGAAYYFLMGSSTEDAVAEGEEAVEEVEEEAKEPLYADVKKILVNIEHKGKTHYVQADMELMSYDQAVIDQARRDMPAIRDRLIILFNSQDFDALKTADGKEAVRAEALVTVNEALGLTAPKVVEQVYFENFLIQ